MSANHKKSAQIHGSLAPDKMWQGICWDISPFVTAESRGEQFNKRICARWARLTDGPHTAVYWSITTNMNCRGRRELDCSRNWHSTSGGTCWKSGGFVRRAGVNPTLADASQCYANTHEYLFTVIWPASTTGRCNAQPHIIYLINGQLATMLSNNGQINGQLATMLSNNGRINGQLATMQSNNGQINGQLATMLSNNGRINGQLATMQSNNGQINGQLATMQSNNG